MTQVKVRKLTGAAARPLPPGGPALPDKPSVPQPLPITPKQALEHAMAAIESDSITITKTRSSAKAAKNSDKARKDADAWNMLRHLASIM